MESSWKKTPASKMVNAKAAVQSSAEAEDERETAELAQDKAKLEKYQTADQIEEFLALNLKQHDIGDGAPQSVMFTDWTWPFLRYGDRQVTVHRYYPRFAVAVDIFSKIGEHEKTVIAEKRRLFAENEGEYGGKKFKVRYAALDWSMDLSEILNQIGVEHGDTGSADR